MSASLGPASPGRMRMFAATVPGLGAILAEEVGQAGGATVTDIGADGRSELVLFDVDGGGPAPVPDLSVAEDVFLEAGRATRADDDSARRLPRCRRRCAAAPGIGCDCSASRPRCGATTGSVNAERTSRARRDRHAA